MRIVKDYDYYERCEKSLEEVTRPFPVEQSHGARLIELCALARKTLDSQFVGNEANVERRDTTI